MTAVLTRAQLTLLEQLLGVEAGELAGLARLGPDTVEALRKRFSDDIFDTLAPTFSRVSKLAPLVPNALVIKVAEKAIPPEVAGRAGGALGVDHQDRVTGVLSGMHAEYLADAAPYVDPRIIPIFTPKIEAELIVPAARELLRRRDYLTASRFVEFATEELARGLEKGLDDDEGVVRTAALVSSSERLSHVVRAFPEGRRIRLISSAMSGAADTVVAGLSVLVRLDADLADELSNATLNDADTAERVVRIAVEQDAAAELLDVIDCIRDDNLDRFRQTGVFDDATIANALSEAAKTSDRRAHAWRRAQGSVDLAR